MHCLNSSIRIAMPYFIKMCSYFARSEPVFKQSYFSRAKSSSSSFIFNCICISSILLFSSMFSFSLSLSLSVSSIYFNFIFSCISISLIFAVSIPKLLTNSKSSSLTIFSSTILLRISNFNMVVLTSKFNYLYRSNNSDKYIIQ